MALDPISLQSQCLIYIIRFLELFPVDYLALLPAAIRHRLLENLPPADICYLEQSRFLKGLDTEKIWRRHHEIVMRYISERHWLNKRIPSNFKDSFFRRVYTLVFQQNQFTLIRCLCSPSHHRHTNMYRCFPERDQWSHLDGNRNYPITIPHRFQQYWYHKIFTHSERYDHFKSVITLIPKLCHYYPKALWVPLHRGLIDLYHLLPHDTALATTMFQQVESLHFTLIESKEQKRIRKNVPGYTCHHYTELTRGSCHRSHTIIETILPPALQVLEELTIEVNTTKTLGVVLERSVPLLWGTTLSQNSTTNLTVIAQNLREFTIILCDESQPHVPISTDLDMLIQHLSSLFSLPHFNSLHLEGIVLRDGPQAHAFGSILYTFLTSPTTHEQSLTCQYIRFEQLKSENYKTMPLPPPVVSSQDSLQYKSLRFERTALSQSLLTWLFQASQLRLRALKLQLEPLSASIWPLLVLPAGIENVNIQRLALHTYIYQHPKHKSRVHHQPSKTYTQLQPAVQCVFDPGLSIQQILLKNTLTSLDLHSSGLGYSGILPYLTEGLINRATMGTLRELNLANNYLAYETDRNLAKLFDAIFCLLQIQKLHLIIGNNGLIRHHFDIIYTSWTNESIGLKLQYLSYNTDFYISSDTHPHHRPRSQAITPQNSKHIDEIMAKIALKSDHKHLI